MYKDLFIICIHHKTCGYRVDYVSSCFTPTDVVKTLPDLPAWAMAMRCLHHHNEARS